MGNDEVGPTTEKSTVLFEHQAAPSESCAEHASGTVSEIGSVV